MECLLCGDAQDYKRSLCAECLSANVTERKKKLEQREEACQPLREQIKSYTDKNRNVAKQNFANDLRSERVNTLKERTLFTKQCIEKDREEVQKLQAQLQARRVALEDARAQLAARFPQVASSPIPKQTEELAGVCEHRASELAHQRRTLISELLSFFPVNPSSGSENDSRIIELILPNNGVYTNYPAELLPAALGYVAHVVHLVTAYLGVMLPYPIEFAGARSAVRNSDDPPRRYPLYGTRFGDMDVGVRLLNNNIVYLCYTQGLCIPRSMYNQTLPNLMLLLRSPTLGWPGPHEEWMSPRPIRQLPPLRVLTPSNSGSSIELDSIYNSSNSNNNNNVSQQQQDKDKDGDEDDFIVLDNTIIPTPSQSEDLAHFERALFIDTS